MILPRGDALKAGGFGAIILALDLTLVVIPHICGVIAVYVRRRINTCVCLCTQTQGWVVDLKNFFFFHYLISFLYFMFCIHKRDRRQCNKMWLYLVCNEFVTLLSLFPNKSRAVTLLRLLVGKRDSMHF